MNDLFFKVLLAVITALIGVIVNQAIPYLKGKYAEAEAKVRQTKWSWAMDVADAAVRAVEQTAAEAIHGNGKKDLAKQFVKSALEQAGVKMTDYQIDTLIEAAVQVMNADAIKIEEPANIVAEGPTEEEGD